MTSQAQISHDWFISAIVKDGSVGDCLGEVVRELQRKEKFVSALHSRISEGRNSSLDAVSEISARIGVLENTLKFRLSILSPERRGAWFRTSATTASGPFSGPVLTDPVFSAFDESQSSKIRKGLTECWTNKNLVGYPLNASEPSLWKTLLAINFELHMLGNLGEWPRLEALPEALPPDLESRSLRAFLTNVKLEYNSARERLNTVYLTLLEASDRFWSKSPVSSSSARSAARQQTNGENYDGFRAAENVRNEFRKRRSSPTIRRPVGKSAQDIEALKFMGFEDFPSEDALKQRYHALALDMHPDRMGGNESRFKLLAKSYKHLRRLCTV